MNRGRSTGFLNVDGNYYSETNEAEPAHSTFFVRDFMLHAPASAQQSRPSRLRHGWNTIRPFLTLLYFALPIITFILSVAALALADKSLRERSKARHNFDSDLVSRVAFGSCTSYDIREQPIWRGIIANRPDAWIWLGDMAYLDEVEGNCTANPQAPGCTCDPTWYAFAPRCLATNVDHGVKRMMMQLSNPQYRAFLDYMCPGHVEKGIFPPTGSDPSVCPRLLVGVYDDHDYVANDQNRRAPNKAFFKDLYLDAVGEPRDSARRGHAKGIEWIYSLNAGDRDKRIDLVLLDERYYRTPLPCYARKDWCEKVILPSDDVHKAWCEDFLQTGGSKGQGSCCTADEEFYLGWCKRVAPRPSDPLWRSACDPWSAEFGKVQLKIQDDDSLVSIESNEVAWDPDTGSMPFCDMLGLEQRQWFEELIAGSDAPLFLVGSGSNVIKRPNGVANETNNWLGLCGGDDFDCTVPARNNLLAQLSRVKGCPIILTGDSHFSDIKVITGAPSASYAAAYGTGGRLQKPIWQVMSSGMTHSTARFTQGCNDPLTKDFDGFRPGGACAIEVEPSFAMINVDWKKRHARLEVRKATGDMSLGVTIDIDTCSQVG